MDDRKIIEVTEFTDTVCTWCWGSEPLLHKLETRYKDQLKIKFIMGGLVKDIRERLNDIGGDVELANRQIAKHCLEAAETHGMPVEIEGFCLFSDEHPSSYPQNIAYKAAQMESEDLANRFLRRIREASATEAKQTNKQEVLIELASEIGLDVEKFIERISSGSAEAAFKDDLNITHKYGVWIFPSFLVKYGEKELLLNGFQSFEAIQSAIKTLTNDSVKDKTPDKSEENVLEFIKKYGRVAPVEIEVSFDYSKNEVQAVIADLLQKKMIVMVPAGNGCFIEPGKYNFNSQF